MAPPRTIWSLCAFLFILMGGIFAALGAVFFLVGFPVRGGPSWLFLPIGGVFLLLGLVCLLIDRRQQRYIRFLKEQGVSTVGEICSIRHLLWINWNTTSFVNFPGQCSPWILTCSYFVQGRRYTVKSLLIWREPASGPQHPTIYLDPCRPARAYVDLDTIRWTL